MARTPLSVALARGWRLGAATAAIAAAMLASATTTAAQKVNPQAVALREFHDRTKAYLELRTRLAKDVAPLPENASAEQIRRHQEQLAGSVRAARTDARPGDVFTPPVVPQFRTIIRRDLQSRDLRDAVAAMQEVPSTLVLRVNDRWPDDAPRATVPPRLLASLHPLPDGLEYRFIGRHLVLLDGEANLIVDFIRNVVPSVVRRR